MYLFDLFSICLVRILMYLMFFPSFLLYIPTNFSLIVPNGPIPYDKIIKILT